MAPAKRSRKPAARSEPVETVPLIRLRPARLNDKVYGCTDPDDPAVVKLAESIAVRGVLEPLIVTQDNVVMSGHRRRMACLRIGMEKVPVRRHWISSDHPDFPAYLVDCNEQRDKTPAQRINEEIIRTSPDEAFAALAERRAKRLDQLMARASGAGLSEIPVSDARRRSKISDGKMTMLNAAIKVLEDNQKYWPLTLRQVHYRLLNDPPPRNADRPRTGPYRNNDESYKDLSDLLTRARVAGLVPWEAITDETRPVSIWTKWSNVSLYVREQLDNLFNDYRRDLLQSQPAHIEIVAEKMTVQGAADRVARQFCANVMVGRGFSSITARYDLAQRFLESGKDTLVLLVLSDFDPEGECIAETLAASIRDEFNIVGSVQAHKVALTIEQVEEYELPPGGRAKPKSSRYAGFVSEYGEDVYELEALEPAQLEALIRNALVAVIDPDLLRQERERERAEAVELEARRRTALSALGHDPD